MRREKKYPFYKNRLMPVLMNFISSPRSNPAEDGSLLRTMVRSFVPRLEYVLLGLRRDAHTGFSVTGCMKSGKRVLGGGEGGIMGLKSNSLALMHRHVFV